MKGKYLRQDKPRRTFADIYSALCEDKALIEAYRLYMLRDLGNKPGTVAIRLRHLHQVFRRAMLEAGLRDDPFDLIDIETPTYERNALSADDLQRLLAYRPHRSVDNHFRLIFLLGCFTGLAFSDLKKLRMEDVYTLCDGRYKVVARPMKHVCQPALILELKFHSSR